MQFRLKSSILFLSVVWSLGSAVLISAKPSLARENKFFCTRQGGVPVTKVRTARGNETFITWKRNFDNYSASKRCGIISNKLQRFYENGFVFIKTGTINKYPVICISNQEKTPCTADNLLVTLAKGEDKGSVLRNILAWRRGTSSKPIDLTGRCFVSDKKGDTSLNVKKLMDGLCDG